MRACWLQYSDVGILQAHLSGGEWVELLEPEHPGIAEVKWCRNRFRPFLCIGPQVRVPHLTLSCWAVESTALSRHNAADQAHTCCTSGKPRVSGHVAESHLAGWPTTVVAGMQKDDAPGQRDAEEFIEVHRFDAAELRRMLVACDMLLPSMTTSFLAFDKLASMRQL